MTADQPATPKPKLRWYQPTPGRLLIVLLVVEGVLLLSEPWFPKGWAVLIAIASVGLFLLLTLLWFVVSLIFRWRFQFSIRSLLVLVIAVAIPSSWLAVEMKWAKEQKEVVEPLKKMGGVVTYDDKFDTSADQPALLWMRERLGDDFFGNVVILNLTLTTVSDFGVEHLKGLTQLQALYIGNTEVSDVGLEHLKGMTQLQELYLGGTKVSDVGVEHLKGLTQLQALDLIGTEVSDVCVEHLKGLMQLTTLYLSGTKVSDVGVEHLKGLTKLQWLYLNDTKVSDVGVRKLQKALPNCKIDH